MKGCLQSLNFLLTSGVLYWMVSEGPLVLTSYFCIFVIFRSNPSPSQLPLQQADTCFGALMV